MKKGDHDYLPSDYSENEWLSARGLVNEKDGQGNTPIHLLSSYQISDFRFLFDRKVDKKAYNSENLTAYDIISRAKEDISKKKILEQFEHVMPETRSLRWKKMRERQRKRREFITAYDIILRHEENSTEERDIMKQLMDEEEIQFQYYKKQSMDEKESKEYNEKRIVALREQGKNHLIVSTLITTVTFAAGFTLPGGYKDDNGKAILSKKALFITFVVADTIAMLSSLSAVFLHFFMTVRKQEDYLAKHLFSAFLLTMIGIGAMAIAFASGLYVVLPPFSALSFLTCILCSCFLLFFILKFSQKWRSMILGMLT
ncbi:ankyrin repeat-containing protein At5g02620-like [Vitis vinifera]|uniref:ankyrin repeat-containing protein At5g02620-like n=1 Tax=Vitis vinifera TaxID=29760 RepID=UPI0008FFDE5F|nr:ankyrin repeat-containing protein At5g02620-like [Vitis vinifera]|eukprot:XP_010650365.2 PREDICTED: ankyrin repeat-containing protein At5g02620-like [Vitis vinifera]